MVRLDRPMSFSFYPSPRSHAFWKEFYKCFFGFLAVFRSIYEAPIFRTFEPFSWLSKVRRCLLLSIVLRVVFEFESHPHWANSNFFGGFPGSSTNKGRLSAPLVFKWKRVFKNVHKTHFLMADLTFSKRWKTILSQLTDVKIIRNNWQTFSYSHLCINSCVHECMEGGLIFIHLRYGKLLFSHWQMCQTYSIDSACNEYI